MNHSYKDEAFELIRAELVNEIDEDLIYLRDILNSQYIDSLMCIFSILSNFDRDQQQADEEEEEADDHHHQQQKQQPIIDNSFHLSMEICSVLFNEWINEAQQLCQILTKPHMKAILLANDIIARRNYSPLPFYNDDDDDDENYCDDEEDEKNQSSSLMFFRRHHHHRHLNHDRSLSSSSSPQLIDLDSIKIVQLIKNSEPLGATVCVGRNGAIKIARVIFGGAAHRSGLIQLGDRIFEVNGINLINLPANECIKILERECRNYSISFKLLPGDVYNVHSKQQEQKDSQMRVKAHFDYSPGEDDFHPCPAAGLSFKRGDILHIVNQEDQNWWQARIEDENYLQMLMSSSSNNNSGCYGIYPSGCRAGIVPSQQLQERRFAYLRDLRTQIQQRRQNEHSVKLPKIFAGCNLTVTKPSLSLFKSRKVKKIMYKAVENFEYNCETIATYDQVAKLSPPINSAGAGQPRPIVFIGPSGVGRNELIRHLLLFDECLYKRPIPHTTRPAKEWEIDGREYYFVRHDWAETELRASRFIEVGRYQGNIYGTHVRAIKEIMEVGCVCLLNPPPQSLHLLCTIELKPFIIFVKPPFNLTELKATRTACYNNNHEDGKKFCRKNFSEKTLKEMILSAYRIEYLYGQYFDYTLVNADFQRTFNQLVNLIEHVQHRSLWAPASWSSDA